MRSTYACDALDYKCLEPYTGLGKFAGGEGGDLPAVYCAKVLYPVLDTELLRSRPLADPAKACGIINNLGK